jgi:pilus assembly protein FimV
VDTREDGGNSSSSSSLSYSLSQLDAIGDVDPVAEADVYLAYGRDLQAEEILKEALRTDPGRIAIRAKLLEVYAKRADTKGVEAQALQLLEMTGGVGEDWLRVQELGRQLDPSNALYAQAGPVEEVDIDTSSDAPPDLQPEPYAPMAPEMGAPLAVEAGASTYDIDIDLDAGPTAAAVEITPPPASISTSPEPGSDFEFEESTESPPARELREAPLDFDFDPPDTSGRVEPTIAEPAARAPVEFDFGDLSLDLDPPAASSQVPEPPEEAPMSFDLDTDVADPMERKLELADEFRRIGDVEGARDLLDEVLNRGNDELRARAQRMLAELD